MQKGKSLLLLFSAFLVIHTLVFPRTVHASPGLASPFDARPTAHVQTGSVSDPTYAYDNDLNSKASFRDDAANGLEVKTFSTSGAPTTEDIGFVDFKMKFEADSGGDFRILYYVSPSGTAVILQDWTTAAFALNTYMWAAQSEPNNNVWSWTEIGDIRFIVEGRADGGAGGSQYFDEYEAWVSVYSYRRSTVAVDPSSLTNPSSPFTIDIAITDVDNLYGWEFKLYYKNSILNGSSYSEGPFLNASGAKSSFFQMINFTDSFNATYGRVWLTCSLLGVVQGTTGSGDLASITFTKKAGASGTTPLDLNDTKLIGYDYSNNRLTYMTHNTNDGSVTYAVSEFPLGAALEIGLIAVIVYIWWRGKRKQPKLPSTANVPLE